MAFDITSGNRGTIITANAGGPNMTGGTVTLKVKPASFAGTEVEYPGTVDSSGFNLLYTTTGVEFPTGGQYNIQLRYVNAGVDVCSPPRILNVAPRLN